MGSAAKIICPTLLVCCLGSTPARAERSGWLDRVASKIAPTLTALRTRPRTRGAATKAVAIPAPVAAKTGNRTHQDPRAAFDRALLAAEDLLRLVKQPRDFVTFQTSNETVARTRVLRPTRKTNPLFARDEVCLFEGFAPLNYGKYYVIFTKAQLGAQARPTSVLPEWRHSGPIDQPGLGYTTHAELNKAGLIGW